MAKAAHPTDKAYEAGIARGKSAARGRYGSDLRAIESSVEVTAKSYEDSEAYVDGFWSAYHKHA